MGLSVKLSAYVVGLTGVVLLVWSLVLSHEAVVTHREEASARAVSTLTALAAPCATSLARRELERLDQVLLAAAQPEDINWIGVVDDHGQFLAHSDSRMSQSRTDRSWVMEGIADEQPTSVVREHELLVTVPVRTGTAEAGLRWGTLVASVSLVEVERRITRRRIWLAVASLAVVAITGASIYYALAGLVIVPVRELHTAAVRMKEGDLSVHVEADATEGELRLLGQVFNEMSGRLRDQTSRLEGAVQRRNEELVAANQELEQINERLGKALAKLADRANTDGLTGLLNHRRFQEKLTLELQRCLRQEHPLSVLMIDVDHFKAYNDYHGHPRGDEVLRQVAACFKESLRELDLVARYGGEEFGVILLDTPKDAASLVAEKLRQAIHEHSFPGEERSQPMGQVTISVGVASFPEDGLSPAELLEAADASLYAAKNAGRNRVVVAPGLA